MTSGPIQEMSSPPPMIVGLDDAAAISVAHVGAKAANLARARIAGLPALTGVVLSTRWTRDDLPAAVAAWRTLSADGATAQAITESGACRAPCWSPDGQQIAYLSSEAGAFDIWTAPAPTGPASSGNPPGRRQVTKGLNADAVSGLSWAK